MNFYLEKYGFRDPAISSPPKEDMEIIVVIPSHNEPDIRPTINSLKNCTPPQCGVEVIVVVNSGENATNTIKEVNQKTIEQLSEFHEEELFFDLHTIHEPDLPKKHAGVGLARKIGMDEAVYRFEQIRKDGIIVCFDADSQCDLNYLKAIEQHFSDHPKTPGCSIYYEHPTNGKEFPTEIYTAITQYELHLRYYKLAQSFCRLPYAFHTVGSSMAVRSSAYQKQGGMNRRKAGEDFYFLHKIIALGDFTELNTTRVIPSPRSSDRVPFGTGRAVQEWLSEEKDVYKTYSFDSFLIIRDFISDLETIYKTDQYFARNDALNQFLEQNNFYAAVEETKSNTTDFQSFRKRFYTWFDAFRLLKLVHFLRDNGYSNQSVYSETLKLLDHFFVRDMPESSFEALEVLRRIERNKKLK